MVVVGVLKQLRSKFANVAGASPSKADAIPKPTRCHHADARLFVVAQGMQCLHGSRVGVLGVWSEQQQLSRPSRTHTATRTQPHADTQKCVRQRRGTLVLCYHVRTMAEGAPQATRTRVRSVLVANFCTIVAMEVCITCSDRPARGSNGSRMSGTQSTVWTRRVHRHEALVETIRAA